MVAPLASRFGAPPAISAPAESPPTASLLPSTKPLPGADAYIAETRHDLRGSFLAYWLRAAPWRAPAPSSPRKDHSPPPSAKFARTTAVLSISGAVASVSARRLGRRYWPLPQGVSCSRVRSLFAAMRWRSTQGQGVLSRYFHQSSLVASTGILVAAGERIGYVGSTGLSTGPRLHWEVRVGGEPVNPWQWIAGVARPAHHPRAQWPLAASQTVPYLQRVLATA